MVGQRGEWGVEEWPGAAGPRPLPMMFSRVDVAARGKGDVGPVELSVRLAFVLLAHRLGSE